MICSGLGLVLFRPGSGGLRLGGLVRGPQIPNLVTQLVKLWSERFGMVTSLTKIFCWLSCCWWQWKIIECCCRRPYGCCNNLFCRSCSRCSCSCRRFWTNFIWFQLRNVYIWCEIDQNRKASVRRALMKEFTRSFGSKLFWCGAFSGDCGFAFFADPSEKFSHSTVT